MINNEGEHSRALGKGKSFTFVATNMHVAIRLKHVASRHEFIRPNQTHAKHKFIKSVFAKYLHITLAYPFSWKIFFFDL